jgi:hypothetical protein
VTSPGHIQNVRAINSMTPLIMTEKQTRIGRVLLFDAFLLPCLYLITRFNILLHEGAHLGLAALFGANVSGMTVSIFGGGCAHLRLSPHAGWAARFFINAGGMIEGLMTGTAALVITRSLSKYPLVAIISALAGALSIISTLTYLVLGLYHGWGDPYHMMVAHLSPSELEAFESVWVPWSRYHLWLAPFLSAPLLAYYVLQPYLAVQEVFFPEKQVSRRLAIFTLTLGSIIAPFAFAACISLIKTEIRLPDILARARATGQLVEQYRTYYPKMDLRELTRLVIDKHRDKLLAIRSYHAPNLFSLLLFPLFLLLAGVGVLVSAMKPQRATQDPPRVTTRQVVWMTLLAASVIVALMALQQPLYYSPWSL